MNEKPFRIWDALTLQEASKIATQLVAITNQVCEENKTHPALLPPSLIPTEKLYILAASFVAAYEKLIEHELVKTGNLRSDKNNLH
jgi:hypothetical protein